MPVFNYQSLESLELSIHTYNALKRNGINSVADILDKDTNEIIRVRSIGPARLKEITKVLKKKCGIDFK